MFQVNDNRILRDFGPKVKKEDVFHTSGYATAANGAKIGTASEGIDVKRRQEIEERRRFVRGYNSARIMGAAYGVRRAAGVVPRTAGGRGNVGAGASGTRGGALRGGLGGVGGTGAKPPVVAPRPVKLPWK